MPRIGFACKYYHPDRTLKKVALAKIESSYNTKTATNRLLDPMPRDAQAVRLMDIVDHNVQSVRNTIEFITKSLPPRLRMYRMSSDLLPLYTHPNYAWFWTDPSVQNTLELKFNELGKEIRSKDILVSFHPGQFVVLASDREEVVNKSIEEFEYHATMARWLGFGVSFQDGCKINVHVGGKRGPEGIREAYKRLSLEARNLITIENDEFSWGLDDVLPLGDLLPIVLDIHHHWINSGEYIQASDARVRQVIDSWRGKIPTMHYSLSQESLLVDKFQHSIDQLPDLQLLLAKGLTRSDLRAHSDFYWNTAANSWACTFGDMFNIMCEAKTKHNAALQLYEQSAILIPIPSA